MQDRKKRIKTILIEACKYCEYIKQLQNPEIDKLPFICWNKLSNNYGKTVLKSYTCKHFIRKKPTTFKNKLRWNRIKEIHINKSCISFITTNQRGIPYIDEYFFCEKVN